LTLCRAWSDLECFFELVSFECLLVLNGPLGVFIALKNLVVFNFPQFQAFVHASFELLTEGIHLNLLLLHQLGFGSEDLLVAGLEVLALLDLLHLVSAELNLVGILIVLLLGEGLLDGSEVEELCGVLEDHGQILLEVLSVLLQTLCVSVLKVDDLSLIFLLGSLKLEVPVLVEILVLFNMGLLDFFLLLLMGEHELLVLHVVFLLLELLDPVLGHLSLDVAILLLAGDSVLLHSSYEVLDVLLVHLGVLTILLVVWVL